jgi:hypothetical protein
MVENTFFGVRLQLPSDIYRTKRHARDEVENNSDRNPFS